MGLLDFLKMPRSDHPDRKAALQGRSQIYNLLDNIIGFDDDRVTPGEAFGADLRENPVGLLSSGLQGATDDMRGLMFEGEAVQRPEDVLMMAAAPMAPNARGLLSRSPDVMNSNPLMGGGTSDPTQTGWTFKDVDRSLKTSKLENRRLAGDTSRVEEVPIRQLYATQPTVNSDFATTSSSAGEMPLVVRIWKHTRLIRDLS